MEVPNCFKAMNLTLKSHLKLRPYVLTDLHISKQRCIFLLTCCFLSQTQKFSTQQFNMLIYYRPEEEWQHTTSEDNSNQLMHPSSELTEYSVSLEGIGGDHEAAEAMSAFPPSFTEMMKNCNPAVAEGYLYSSIMSYETFHYILVLVLLIN